MNNRILLVDDHVMFREGLRLLLESAGFHIAGEARDAREALVLAQRVSPDLVLVDVVLARSSGLTLARELRGPSRTRVLAVTALLDDDTVSRAFAVGVAGYATKSDSPEEILDAVRTVAAGGTWVSPRVQWRTDEARPATTEGLATLTTREREVFDLVVRGIPEDVIGHELGITARTVETHRGRALKKLRAHSVADLVRLAAGAGVYLG